jgi:hypothetical protein
VENWWTIIRIIIEALLAIVVFLSGRRISKAIDKNGHF